MLKNKVVIVTGASSGIGLEIVKDSLLKGAKVMIHASHNSLKTAQALVKEFGDNTSCVAADLSKFDELENIVNETVKVFGRVDCLVNCAGVFPRNNIETIQEDEYNYIMDVNFKAPLFLCKAVVNHFLKNNIKGSIVNIGSVNAYCGQNDLLVYSASKGALMTMTRNMADYLNVHEIRINQINVGWTHTDKEHETQLKEGNSEDWFENVNKVFAPRGTILAPQEIAKHVSFWLSDESVPANGSIYEVEQYPLIGRNKINA